MIDTEELAQEGQPEGSPAVELPEHPAGKTQSRQELIDSTLEEAGAEAGQESIFQELENKEELTVEDLRKLPGAEGLTDEQIQAEWNKAVAAEANSANQQAQQETFKLPFPIYDKEGNKIDALEKISVRDLFEGKLQLGYNALGKEQRKTLAEAIRNASMGHWNEQKYNTTVEERNRVASDLAKANEQIATFSDQRKTWDAALTALSMGDINPMRQLVGAWQKELTKSPQAVPGYIPVEQVRAEREQEARGQQYINETITPAAIEIAKRYNADSNEVLAGIAHFIRNEPPQFLTQAKIDSILQYDVPAWLESNGLTPTDSGNARSVNQPNNEVAELKKTVQALQERIAGTANQQTQQLREKSKKAPPSGGGAVPGAGDSMPTFKSRSQMKAWMQNDPEWARA